MGPGEDCVGFIQMVQELANQEGRGKFRFTVSLKINKIERKPVLEHHDGAFALCPGRLSSVFVVWPGGGWNCVYTHIVYDVIL